MSDEETWNAEENLFLQQVEAFYTSWSFTKLCAKKCNILKAERNPNLSDGETNCLNTCAQNIEATKKNFYAQVREVFNSGNEE